MTAPVIGVVALAVALVATPLVIRLATSTGVVDRPGELKPQSVAVPYLGGIAVFAGSAVGAIAGRPSVLVPLAGALVLGLFDDLFDLPPAVRLVAELVIGATVVATCPVHLPGGLAAVAVVAVVAVTVLLINGVNLLDGLDLLAGGVAAVAAIAFALMPHGPEQDLAIAVAASLLGFLAFNRPPARVYLGDGGAYLVGTALAVLLAGAWAPHTPVRIGLVGLALVAVPVAEVACAVVRRTRGHQALAAGDRGHPYDRLVDRGWPRPTASLAYIGAEAVVAVVAVLVARHGSLPAALALDLVVGAVLLTLAGVAGGLSPDPEPVP